MEDGPPRFPPDCTCPVVLRIPLELTRISRTGLSPRFGQLSRCFRYRHESHVEVLQPQRDESLWFGLFRVRSPLLAESLLISFPPGTEMFHFPGLASLHLCIQCRMLGRAQPVSRFGHLRIKGRSAPPRRFSQLATSFIASMRQGIHRPPLVA